MALCCPQCGRKIRRYAWRYRGWLRCWDCVRRVPGANVFHPSRGNLKRGRPALQRGPVIDLQEGR